MLKVKALTSFVGLVCMTRGEVREIPEPIAADLLNAQYVEVVEEPKKETKRKKKGE